MPPGLFHVYILLVVYFTEVDQAIALDVPFSQSVRCDNLLEFIFVDSFEDHHVALASLFPIQHVFYFVADLFHFVGRRRYVHLHY